MDDFTRSRLHDNTVRYKQSLDRIIEKYSKLQGAKSGGIEVDLDSLSPKSLGCYIKLSQKKLRKLESKELTDSRYETLTGQHITGASLLDLTCQGGGADETSASQDAGVSINDVSQMAVKSPNESQRNFSDLELQPEDQDEELQMSLSSHSSSLVELYPSMLSRIKKAWERQHISSAANSVLKRYRRWRQQANRSHLSDTFNVSWRQNSSPEKVTSRALFNDRRSPETSPQRPLRMMTNMLDWSAQQQIPSKERSSLKQEQHHAVFEGFCDSSEASLNKTYTTSQLEEQACGYTDSSAQLFNSTARASMDSSFRAKRFSLSALSVLNGSVNSSDTTTVRERSGIYRSPVRQSPLKAKMLTSFVRSPHAFSRSPREDSRHGCPREAVRCRSLSTSTCSPQRPVVLLRMCCPQDSPSVQRSPQSTTAAHSRHRLRRHLSFDSAQPSSPVSFSPKKVDEDFMRVYHKFACQNKSGLFNGHPCRQCAQSSEENRGHSSSSLAALALSPHRSILRKRHREKREDSHPHSKRIKEEYCMSSPGSTRHNKEMLRRFSPSEQSLSHGKYNTVQRFLQSRKRLQLFVPVADHLG